MKHLLNWGPLTNDIHKQCLHQSLHADAEVKVRISEMSAGQHITVRHVIWGSGWPSELPQLIDALTIAFFSLRGNAVGKLLFVIHSGF